MIIALDVDGVIVNTANEFAKTFDMDYWKQANLYDKLLPHQDTQIVIDILSKYGEVHFVSSCHDEHYWSKYKFLKKYFPKIALHNLSNKGHFPANLLIDDREEVIDEFLKRQKKAKAILTIYGNTLEQITQMGYV